MVLQILSMFLLFLYRLALQLVLRYQTSRMGCTRSILTILAHPFPEHFEQVRLGSLARFVRVTLVVLLLVRSLAVTLFVRRPVLVLR